MKNRPQTHPSARSQHKILVVGAGIAGLSAAFRLQQAGYDVSVLESTSHVGGRMWTDEVDGFRIDTGAAMLPDSYHQMRRLIRDAGLTQDVVPSGDVYGFLRGGRIHRFGKHVPLDLLTTKLLSARSKLRLLRLAADTRRLGDRIDFRDLTRAPEADESCIAYTDRRLNEELFDYLIEPLSTNYYFAPPEELSMTHVYLAAGSALGTGYFNSPQGVAFLPRGLARQLDVRHHTRVLSVEEKEDSVTVTCADRRGEHRETVAACVIAVPGPSVAGIWPGLPAQMRTYLSRLRYSTCLHVSFGLSARPREPSMWIFVPRRPRPVSRPQPRARQSTRRQRSDHPVLADARERGPLRSPRHGRHRTGPPGPRTAEPLPRAGATDRGDQRLPLPPVRPADPPRQHRRTPRRPAQPRPRLPRHAGR
jgi:oxygen-dependent protoporphyrinogen oxidase